jgi:chitin synthase
MKDHVNRKPVTAHLFEYTTQVCVTPDLKVHGHDNGFVPVQVLFCLKEKNAKKINSHRWFFNSFGPLIRPDVCILIDCKLSIISILTNRWDETNSIFNLSFMEGL